MTALADLRFALRQLSRRPGFTLLAVLTLGLGTGAATAIFTLVDGVLLRPLPFPESGRLVTLCETNPSLEGFCVASPPDVEDFARARAFASIGLGRTWTFNLRGASGATGVNGGLATAGLFRTLGVRPALGRLLMDDDAGRRVALLTDDLWRARFGAAPDIVGRSVTLDGEPYEVVGVLPAGVEVPHLATVKLWTSLPFDPRDEDNRRWRGFITIGRLASGVTAASAANELAAIQASLGERYPATNRGWGVTIRPLLESVVGSVRPTLLVFFGAVGILLLVACANVASLLVARGIGRERELAVRAAVGAGPGALIRLLGIESLVLAGLGGGAGLVIAIWGADAMLALMPRGLPRLHGVSLDGRVLGFAAVLTVATALLAGLAPALRAMRVDLAGLIKAGGRSSGDGRALGLRGGLVVAEVALACLLAVGAGLLTRSFASLLHWDPGFDRAHVVTFWTYASSGTYRDAAAVTALFERLETDLRALPGVTGVGMTSNGPLFGGEETGEFFVEGAEGAAPIAAHWYDQSPGYQPTLGLPLRRGRAFTAADRAGAPRVALINETMARRAFGDAEPVGRRLRPRNDDGSLEVVGVVADVAPFVPGEAPRPEVYWPFAQAPRWASYFILRSDGDPATLMGAVAARLAAVDPDLRPSAVATMDDLVDAQLARPRFHMILIGLFAGIALALTLVGVYGVLAAAVAARTRELGVRLALGATTRRVLVMVMKDGLSLAGAGLAIGLVAALALARFVGSLLYGVRARDPLTFASVGFLLLAAAALACFLPARRAAGLDPMAALREE